MGALRNIAIAVAAISFVTFVALFGQLPALRRTPIGWLQRLLCLHIPSGMRKLDQRATGGAITAKSKRLGQYLFYEKNPIVLILFLGLTTGSIALFLFYAIQELPTSLILPIPFLVSGPYIFTYLCAAHKDHYITTSTHHTRIWDYPYDHTLFHPGVICSTCNLPKPARSKHCSLCGVCVAMCDHHCPWVNNCVGRGNYRYFLALLLSLGSMEVYGAYLSYWILQPFLKVHSEGSWFSQEYWDVVFQVIVVAINAGGLSIAGVGMLAVATAALPLGLLAYHCYLIWAGMTTNESQKWSDLREDMADGFVFKSTRDALKTRNGLRKYGDRADAAAQPSNSVDHTGASMSASMRGVEQDEGTPYVSWPITSEQIVVRTVDGQPPTGQEALWSQVWTLSDVINLYDLGGWDNFVEVLRGR